ncbi:MAG: trypsin-like peptidase domain-containing protein [Rhizobiaceae bacterium]|nr:trypsin-like peptidase domain-containing protein [Rhizobiaceae bacterium]
MANESNDATKVEFFPGNRLSYAIIRIEVLCNNNVVSLGTGFVLKYGEEYGLVTNWHVVSGRHPVTGNLLSRHAIIPDSIRFHVTVVTKEQGEGDNTTTLYFKPLALPLEVEGVPTWMSSRTSTYQNDIAVIPLADKVSELGDANTYIEHIRGGTVTLKRGLHLENVNTKSVAPSDINFLYPQVGSDVFVLGYPKGVELGGVFPIWKRGSIASEPQATITSRGLEYNNLIYLDALTKEGMSGAPVISLSKAGSRLVTDDGVAVVIPKDEVVFVGVYAGREGVTEEEYEFSIGRVWKAQTVAEIFHDVSKVRARQVSDPF